jgi:hypothetical protein
MSNFKGIIGFKRQNLRTLLLSMDVKFLGIGPIYVVGLGFFTSVFS